MCLERAFSGYLAYFFEVVLRGDTKGSKRGKETKGPKRGKETAQLKRGVSVHQGKTADIFIPKKV